MANKLYNGIELPDIDTVWTDKVTYPYAVIASTYNGESYCLYLSTVPLFVHKYSMIGNSIRLHGTDDGSVIGYRGVTPFSEWERIPLYDNTFAAGENACPAIHDNVEWANYDIYNEDGSVHLAASDPVPVPDEPETVLSWQKHDAYKPNTKWDGNTFYRVMGGKWVKQGGVVPTE